MNDETNAPEGCEACTVYGEFEQAMGPQLTAALKEKGWTPERVSVWGRRVSGDAHGVTIEKDGKSRYYAGPFVSIRGGDQIAIVRWN